MEKLVRIEQRGGSVESGLVDDELSVHDLSYYRQNRVGFILQLAMESLAGVAAENVMQVGAGTIGESDLTQAREMLLMVVDPARVNNALSQLLRCTEDGLRTRHLEKLEYIATRLQQRRTLFGEELNALWSQCAEMDTTAMVSPG